MTNQRIKVILIVLLTIFSLLYGCMAQNASEGGKSAEKISAYVEKVIDGDSVEASIQGKREQIRLIGIDSPELGQKPWGKRSKKFLESLIAASGWQVQIEYDLERRDQYNRVLAYLWTRDKRMINDEMLRNGYALLYTFPPDVKYIDRLKSAQVIARENKRGIWSRDGLKQLPSEYRKENPRK